MRSSKYSVMRSRWIDKYAALHDGWIDTDGDIYLVLPGKHMEFIKNHEWVLGGLKIKTEDDLIVSGWIKANVENGKLVFDVWDANEWAMKRIANYLVYNNLKGYESVVVDDASTGFANFYLASEIMQLYR